MSTTTPPTGGGRPPGEDELREMVARGREELGVTDELRLQRFWRSVQDHLYGDTERPGATRSAASARSTAPPIRDVAVAGDRPAVPPREIRGWRGVVPVAAAAALALVVGVGAGLAWSAGNGAGEPLVAATWDLEPLDGAETGTTGVAAVLTESEGVRSVEVDLATLPSAAAEHFHEVWLLDPETGALASLGPVRPDGRYVVPQDLDLAALTALDVSTEPLDGDPGHSGDSLLRGEVVWTG